MFRLIKFIYRSWMHFMRSVLKMEPKDRLDGPSAVQHPMFDELRQQQKQQQPQQNLPQQNLPQQQQIPPQQQIPIPQQQIQQIPQQIPTATTPQQPSNFAPGYSSRLARQEKLEEQQGGLPPDSPDRRSSKSKRFLDSQGRF